MSSELEEHDDVREEPSNPPATEEISLDDQDENEESPLATPNGRQTPSATSFSDVIIEKPLQTSAHPLLQIINEKSNKDASSAILNTVSEYSSPLREIQRNLLLVGQW